MNDPSRADDASIPHLRTFAKAAELCSFTAAARALGVTQAAISQRVHLAEEALGTPLFQRRGGRVRLTEAGRKLYTYSQRIFDLQREARREITGHEAAPTGELAVGASSIPGEHLLPALLTPFTKKYPHIHVRATISDSMAVLAQLERGDVCLGLVGRKNENPHLVFHYLASDRLVLVVPPDHPLSQRKRISVKQLPGYTLILREVGSGLRHCFEKSLERAGKALGDLRIALELGSNEAIKEAILRGIGAAVLSTFAVEKELKTGQLHAVNVSDLHCDRDMFIVYDTRRVLPAPARLFLAFLETHPITTPAS